MDLKSFVADSFLMLDGGMGTMLMQAGMPAGSLPELMSISSIKTRAPLPTR